MQKKFEIDLIFTLCREDANIPDFEPKSREKIMEET